MSGFFCGKVDGRVHRVTVCKNSFCDCCRMTKVSSTYIFHSLGGFTADVRTLCSKDSIYKFSTKGLTGDPIAAPIGLLIKFTLEQEIGVTLTEFQSSRMLLADMIVLLWSAVSCSNLFFIIWMADVTGMDVNREEIS